ncbi:MAG: GreA/GreB family elongation factor [Deltaproteobacteria bacterium]|nr:GreA/GreB family elongation factor [Deltaproteobacteria bacterium]
MATRTRRPSKPSAAAGPGPARPPGSARSIDKERVLAALRARVALTLADVETSQRAAHAGAIHEETRAEDPKDMRSTEASYLARGLALRVGLRAEAQRLAVLALRPFGADDPIALSALAGLEDQDGSISVVFVVAGGGGEALDVDGVSIRPVTPGSPLGRALVGAEAGDSVEVDLPGGRRELTITWVA